MPFGDMDLQSPQKLLAFYQSKDESKLDFADIKHTQEFYRGTRTDVTRSCMSSLTK